MLFQKLFTIIFFVEMVGLGCFAQHNWATYWQDGVRGAYNMHHFSTYMEVYVW